MGFLYFRASFVSGLTSLLERPKEFLGKLESVSMSLHIGFGEHLLRISGNPRSLVPVYILIVARSVCRRGRLFDLGSVLLKPRLLG